MGAIPHQPLIALAVATLLGCGGSQRATVPAATITLSVTSPSTCNHGRPLQAVVRAVTLKQFVEDQYRAIAQLVVSPDESVLTTFVVFPGVPQTIKLTAPTKGAAAVYFLFTDATGTTWKQQLDPSASLLHLELAEAQIVQPGAPSTSPH